MRKIQYVGTVLVVAVGLIAGCKKTSTTNSPAMNDKSARTMIKGTTGTEPVAILKSVSAADPAFQKAGTLLINAKDDAYANMDTSLEPDYATQSVVVIALGEVENGGYGVNIDSAQIEGGNLFVNYTLKTPKEGEVYTQVIQYPYAAIVIPKFTGQVYTSPTK